MKINQCFPLVAITSLLLVGWLSRSAAAAGPSLRLTPCAQATAEQIKLLGRYPDDLEREQSLFVEWSKIPNIVFKTNFPESIISLRRLRSAWEPWGPQEAGYTFGPARIAALTAKGW